MSIRHVKNYYDQVEKQFFEMNTVAKELSEECSKGNISQDRVEQAQQMTLQLRQNYERLSYIMYLLNKPNRSKKNKWYEKQNHLLKDYFYTNFDDEESCLRENDYILSNFKQFVKYLKEVDHDN